MAPSLSPANWFGLINGAYFGEPPAYVSKDKKPGMSEVPKPTLPGWLAASPFVLVTSPNFIWAVVSLLVYFLAPYDLSATGAAARAPLSLAFLAERLPLWLGVTLAYVGFFHLALYPLADTLAWAKRPFIEGRVYSLEKVAHNVFWTTSGVVIWTGFENVFAFLWATGRLSYVPDADSFGKAATPEGMLRFALGLALVPVWRSVHFYFAHRLLHFGPMYQQVHSLHHRNTDIEPFAGLCMHPVEHLYYFACVLPSLLFLCSPFAFLWNGVHLLLSPAASHSGWEDHTQSDSFHYMHHRYFECNYAGSDASFLDVWFGTFVGSMEAKDKDGVKPRADAKSTLRAVPTGEFATYLLVSCALVAAWAQAATSGAAGALAWQAAAALACGVGFGPVLLASLVSAIFDSPRGVKPKNMSTIGSVGHIAIGTAFCSVPVAWACWLALSPAGSAAMRSFVA